MNKYAVELIGSFFLFLTFGLTAVLGTAGPLAPLAIGGVLAVLTYAGRSLSGAHYNPAITLAMFIRGRCAGKEIGPYLLAQFLGAAVASFFVLKIFGPAVLDAGKDIQPIAFNRTGAAAAAVGGELFFTFVLVFVFLHVMTSRALEANPSFGLAIGAAFMAGAFAVGPISLGGLNPALSTGLCLTGRLPWADSWIHLLPQFLGAVLAAFTFKGLLPEEA